MPSRSRLLGSALLLVLMLFGRVAAARERVAVYVAVDGDAALAENLAEVTIAKLAETGKFELVGPRELATGARDVPMVRKGGLTACVELPRCLAEVGERARTPRAIVGKLRRDGARYDLTFALLRTDPFEIERQNSVVITADLGLLIGTVQTQIAELMKPSVSLEEPLPAPSPSAPPPAPPMAIALIPVAPPPARAKHTHAATAVSPRRKETQWLKYVGFAAAGLSVVALSAAAVNASAASTPPQGATRGARQTDIDKRRDQATAATALFVSGGGLGAVAVVSFAWP